ncbi:MAG: MBOAT family protein [Candidatus Hydrogenedentes bacterium]|nr:MBOAT family protein [Candidatus Hydrogenedentota bacterium]
MLFSEPLFFVFFAAAFSVYWVTPWNAARKTWLLIGSYYFYGSWDWRFLLLIFAATLANYLAALLMTDARPQFIRKAALWSSVLFSLGVLGFFKYYNFFVVSATSSLSWLGIDLGDRTLPIILPVGISFFTFQAMSYTIDCYRGDLKPVRSFQDFALFISFFPQLVAGPIVRSSSFLPQLNEKKFLSNVRVRPAIVLFLVGFIKKVCVADNLAPSADVIFGAAGDYGPFSVWIGVLSYAAQIYCDFSGYTDMAIATAALLGYELEINFRWPYLASNIQEFWRRWHISLSTWLRDYLYIPLGGNKGNSKWLTHRNLMITMLLGGLWHGASWNFVIWGGLHGMALLMHRMLPGLSALSGKRIVVILSTLITFYWVCIAWIFFRAATLQDAATLLQSFALLTSEGTKQIPEASSLAVILAALAVCHWIEFRMQITGYVSRLPVWAFALFVGFMAALSLPFVPTDYRPFVYFQF